MNNDRIAKLENNKKLKKKIFGKNIWRNYAFMPPSLVLFAGVIGIVYLLRADQLLTVYSIPFFLIFFLGTIWFKATQRYLINKKISESKTFLVCLCIPLISKGKDKLYIFSTGKNRNNKYYLEKEKKELLEKQSDFDFADKKNRAFKAGDKDDIRLVKAPTAKRFSPKTTVSTESTWIIYSDNETVDILPNADINRYS